MSMGLADSRSGEAGNVFSGEDEMELVQEEGVGEGSDVAVIDEGAAKDAYSALSLFLLPVARCVPAGSLPFVVLGAFFFLAAAVISFVGAMSVRRARIVAKK